MRVQWFLVLLAVLLTLVALRLLGKVGMICWNTAGSSADWALRIMGAACGWVGILVSTVRASTVRASTVRASIGIRTSSGLRVRRLIDGESAIDPRG